jgi:hypothetical protein
VSEYLKGVTGALEAILEAFEGVYGLRPKQPPLKVTPLRLTLLTAVVRLLLKVFKEAL